jgi:hypothetical protein
VRATFDETTIRVYQAFSPSVAIPALEAGRFVSPFKMDRMTWIKPSFNWMMYRSGFASKPGQEHILGIDILRTGFDWALRQGVLSAFDAQRHGSYENWTRLLSSSCVRIQWDPDRDWRLQKDPVLRTIQIGLSGLAVRQYVHEWIVRLEDLTQTARLIGTHTSTGIPPFRRPDQNEADYPIRFD